MRIHALRPRVRLEAASKRLFRSGWRRLLGRTARGTLAEFYVPYFVFSVEAEVNGRRERSFWAIDGRDGTLDAIWLRRPPAADDLVELETTNSMDFQLDEARARAILEERIRSLYHARRGPSALRQFSLTIAVPAQRLHWPFWVAAIDQHTKPQIEALDAIYGSTQGQKWKDTILGKRQIRPSLRVGRVH